MGISELDLQDEARARAAYDTVIASKALERPWFQPPSFEESLIEWRHQDGERKIMWVADEDGVVVGQAVLFLPLEDNTTKAWFDLQVHPEHRGKGHGTALLETVLDRVRAEGRTLVLVEFMAPTRDEDHPYAAFARRHGFTLNNTEVIRHRDLPVPVEVLDEHDAASRPRWEGRYRLESYSDGVPVELRESLCEVMNQLIVDAPTGDVEFEPESFTPEKYEDFLRVLREQKRVRLTTVAIAEEGEQAGDVVAYTDIVLPSGAPTRAWQWGTYVHRAHRGHRLGMAIKVENLRRLQADHPERDRVVTGNDGTNDFMVSINEELGFRIVEFAPAYSLTL